MSDFVIFNDESRDPNVGDRRSYECAQIVGPGNIGDVVPTGSFQFQRHLPGEPADWASFETLWCPHAEGIWLFKLDYKIFTYSVKKGFFRSPGLPARIEATLPSACVLAAVVGVAIPMKVQNAASIRCVYAYLQQGTSDSQSAFVVKYSTDGGTTWNVLEKMGIAQSLPTPFKNTWDFLVSQGTGSRRHAACRTTTTG